MEITIELLKKDFEKYNKMYFNGELAMCRFTYRYMRDAFGKYKPDHTTKGDKIGHIWISKSVDWDEEKLKQIVVHEMIHHYVHTIDGVSFDGLFQHGFYFVRQTRRLKKQFGYEVVPYYPFWHFKNDKNTYKVNFSSRLTHIFGNKLHLF